MLACYRGTDCSGFSRTLRCRYASVAFLLPCRFPFRHLRLRSLLLLGISRHLLQYPLLDRQTLPLGHILARQEVVVQPTRLVDAPERARGEMESHHLVQRFGVHPLLEDVRLERSLGLLHAERHVVAAPDVLAVVQAAAGSIGSVPDLPVLLRDAGTCGEDGMEGWSGGGGMMECGGSASGCLADRQPAESVNYRRGQHTISVCWLA